MSSEGCILVVGGTAGIGKEWPVLRGDGSRTS